MAREIPLDRSKELQTALANVVTDLAGKLEDRQTSLKHQVRMRRLVNYEAYKDKVVGQVTVGDDDRFVLASRNPRLLEAINKSNLQTKADVSNRITQKQIDAEVATQHRYQASAKWHL